MNNPYTKVKNDVLKIMTNLYLMFCFPKYIISTLDGEITINMYWTDEKMEDCYHEYENLLTHYNKEEAKYYANLRSVYDMQCL